VVLRNAIPALSIGLLALFSLCFGYGGFEVTSTFNDVSGLNHTLDLLNREWNGTREIAYRSPLWWIGGHGGGQVGPVTLGGSGALSVWHNYRADSLDSRLFAIRASFEAGFPYSPNEWVSIRPCVELGGNGSFVYAQTIDAGTKKWFAAWTVGAAPGAELMGSLPTSSGSSIGLFVKASYFIPISGPTWFGDKDPPAFSLSGFALQIGLRFGKTTSHADDELFGY
jgi:hypothetical protein